MKRILPILALSIATNAAEPVFEVGVDNGRTNVVEGLERALFTLDHKQLTSWTADLTVLLPATNQVQLVIVGETNKIRGTMGFSDPVDTTATKPQNMSGKVFIRLKP